MSDVLVLTHAQSAQIASEGETAYPNECCGAILGKDVGGQRLVSELLTLANAFEAGEQYHRFSVSPKQLMEVEKAASDKGLLVIGFYHSHPDAPARPSEYDRTHAWPFYSYVIVSIAKRQAVDMTSWLLDDATETFSRQEILEI